MKKVLLAFMGFLILSSCYKEEIRPQEPLSPQPIITDTTFVDSTLTLEGSTWVIYKVLNTDFIYQDVNDTLLFLSNEDYVYNQFYSKYNLDLTPNSFVVSLYDTPWGNLSGKLYNYNLVSGRIDGLDFYDIFNTERKIKIWIKKI
jgi:hypothetical protein